jgi:hypothetical protein
MNLPPKNKQNGNVLFIILIAIALFAALAFTITQSDRTSNSAMDKEQAIVYATDIAAIAAGIAGDLNNAIAQGAGVSTISTQSPGGATLAGAGTLNSQANFCITGATCLFAPDGHRGTVPRTPPAGAFENICPAPFTDCMTGAGSFNGLLIDGLAPGTGSVGTIAVATLGTAAAEEMVEVFPLKLAVCEALNRMQDITGAVPGAPPSGKRVACYNAGALGYMYYHVLIEH